jgi:AcrR family transcriptional regulator
MDFSIIDWLTLCKPFPYLRAVLSAKEGQKPARGAENEGMPRKPRKPEEIEAEKERILSEALDIITESGYEGLTMRGLGQRLGVAAKTIYNYFRNKDEVYLQVGKREFEALHRELLEGYNSSQDPFEKLEAMTKRFLAFGLSHSSNYDLMFSLQIPKSRDFFGSPSEDMAVGLLSGALRVRDLIVRVINQIAKSGGDFTEEEIVLHSMSWLTGMHGILSLYNNAILSYLHDRPESTLETLAEFHLRNFQPERMNPSGARSSRRSKPLPRSTSKKETGRTKKR